MVYDDRRWGSYRDKALAIDLALTALCLTLLVALVPVYALVADENLRFFLSLACGGVAGVSGTIAAMRLKSDILPEKTGIPIHSFAGKVSWTNLIAAIPDPAIVLDGSSVILGFNSAAVALFDRLSTGLPLEHVHRDPELLAAVKGAQEGETRTARLVASKGVGRRLSATVTPISEAEGHTGSVLIMIQDQSEQHRLLEMRSDFIANASHELRTPLASVRGFIETLQGPARNDDAARLRFLGIMADQAERMTRLIEDLLLLSRVEEKVNLKPTGRTNLNELVDDVVTSLGAAADERGIKISVDPSAASLVAIGDRDELFQVFHNLIENAVKYGHEGGAVRISLSKSISTRGADSAVVSIADDGPGIAPEHIPRLTERFYRVSTEHSRQIGGTGLGLAIVKHVLTRHLGELHIDSIVGHGTTFKVVLPTYKVR